MHALDHYYYYYYYHHHHNYHNGTGYIYGSRPSWYTDTGKSTVRVHSTHKRPAIFGPSIEPFLVRDCREGNQNELLGSI